MKRNSLLLTLAITCLLAACGGSPDLGQLTEERDELMTRVNGLESQMTNLADEAEVTLNDHVESLRTVTAERNTLAAQLQAVTAERDDLTMQVEQLVGQLSSMNQNLETAQSKLSELSEEIEDVVVPDADEAQAELAEVESVPEAQVTVEAPEEVTTPEGVSDNAVSNAESGGSDVAAIAPAADGQADDNSAVAEIKDAPETETADLDVSVPETADEVTAPSDADVVDAPILDTPVLRVAGEAHPNLPGSAPSVLNSHPNLPGN